MHITGYGACTWMFGPRVLEDVADRLAAMHYDGVELGELDPRPASAIKKILSDRGLSVFSLTPANVDLAHPDKQKRDHAAEYYLSLLDYASQVGSPMISCHGAVGRIRPKSTWEKEWSLMVKGVRRIAKRADRLELRIAIELLNRYESHLLNNVDQGLEFLAQVDMPNVGLNLDAFHMNIEEPSLADAVRRAGKQLFVFHAADSNRQSVGRGHTDWASVWQALRDIDYCGPVIVETPAPGPDPFQAIKDESSLGWVETYLGESIQQLRALSQ